MLLTIEKNVTASYANHMGQLVWRGGKSSHYFLFNAKITHISF